MSIYSEPIEWIRESIESILNQTYKDFEFIIVNDNPGRAENVDILNYYSNLDGRIIIISNLSNLGLTRSLNIAIKEAKGDFIARMDADDISLPQRLEKQVALMRDNPDCNYCSTDAIVFSEGKEDNIRKAPKNNEQLADVVFSFNPICHPSVMFRIDFSNKDNLYDEDCKKSQDYELWLRFLIQDKKYLGLSEPLIRYRISDKQISTKQIKAQAEYASLAKEKALSLYFQNLGLKNIRFSKHTVDEVYKSIRRNRKLEDVDKIIIFYLCMSQNFKFLDSFELVCKSIFKYKLNLKRVSIIFLSMFTTRYQGYNISKELKNICK